jgi:hypothetical protein
MQLKTKIIDLQAHLHELDTIKQIRLYLKVNQLRLVTTIYSDGFSCLDWDMTDYRVGGILNLSIRIKISSMKEEGIFFESRGLFPVRKAEVFSQSE